LISDVSDISDNNLLFFAAHVMVGYAFAQFLFFAIVNIDAE
jgi:hypothetical protein